MAVDISVIVPVYKVEKFLHACVDSILTQTFWNFEILLIDDGSPDLSGKICDDYATMDSRVRVIHKKNGGVSSARQCGIMKAQGKWIIFVDSDDILPPYALEYMYNASEGYSMVIGNIGTNDKKKFSFQIHKNIDKTSMDWVMDMLKGTIHTAPYAKLIKRECLDISFFKLPNDIVYAEDFITNVRLAININKVHYIPYTVYIYTIDNINSITNRFVYTLDYGMKVYDYITKAVNHLGICHNSKSMRMFYLNILKHVTMSLQYDKSHPFVKENLFKITMANCGSFKNILWLLILKNKFLYSIFAKIRQMNMIFR